MEKIYAFIDSQNLNLSVLDQGWRLDFEKLYLFLKYKYRAEKIYLFIGHLKENQTLYNRLEKIGFTIIFKPVLRMFYRYFFFIPDLKHKLN